MDNILVDFNSGLVRMSNEINEEYAGRHDEILGVFKQMDPMAMAIEMYGRLSERYDG